MNFFLGIYFFSLFVLFAREAIFMYDDWKNDGIEFDPCSILLYFVPGLNSIAAIVALLNFSFWLFDGDN